MKERHGAIVYIDTKYLLELLDMKDGTIHKVYQPEGYMFPDPDYFAVLVEHPDLPVVPHGESAQAVRPELTITYDESGYPVKTVRSYPPHTTSYYKSSDGSNLTGKIKICQRI